MLTSRAASHDSGTRRIEFRVGIHVGDVGRGRAGCCDAARRVNPIRPHPPAAFESLAQRFEAMAAQRAIKPWWRRLLQRTG
jgi:hypothetical protein